MYKKKQRKSFKSQNATSEIAKKDTSSERNKHKFKCRGNEKQEKEFREAIKQ
jgi:hypothetical protein